MEDFDVGNAATYSTTDQSRRRTTEQIEPSVVDHRIVSIQPSVQERTNEREEIDASVFAAQTKKSVPDKMKLKLKDGAAVDPDSGTFVE